MRILPAFLAAMIVALAASASAQEAAPMGSLYVALIKTGPAWDASRKPAEQPFFREHSANLRNLRDAGSLVMGARYADTGLVLLQAATRAEADAMMQQDPAMQARVFVYELHDFNVFYSGNVQARPRRSSP